MQAGASPFTACIDRCGGGAPGPANILPGESWKVNGFLYFLCNQFYKIVF